MSNVNDTKKKIVVATHEGATVSRLLKESMKEKYGEDIEIVTQSEAVSENISPAEIYNEEIKIRPLPKFNTKKKIVLSGKEKRRERRLNSRMF